MRTYTTSNKSREMARRRRQTQKIAHKAAFAAKRCHCPSCFRDHMKELPDPVA